MTQIFDLLIAEDYQHDGDTRTSYHNVGVAFANKNGDGFTLKVPPGITISGKVLMLPRKDKANTPPAQASAA